MQPIVSVGPISYLDQPSVDLELVCGPFYMSTAVTDVAVPLCPFASLGVPIPAARANIQDLMDTYLAELHLAHNDVALAQCIEAVYRVERAFISAVYFREQRVARCHTFDGPAAKLFSLDYMPQHTTVVLFFLVGLHGLNSAACIGIRYITFYLALCVDAVWARMG